MESYADSIWGPCPITSPTKSNDTLFGILSVEIDCDWTKRAENKAGKQLENHGLHKGKKR